MEGMILNPVNHEQPFGLLIVMYFFIAGLSAGCLLISTLWTVFKCDNMKVLAKPAAYLSLITFMPAPVVLIGDLASPLKFYLLMFNFNPMSMMAWGTWIVSFYGMVLALYCFIMWQNREVNRGIGLASVFLAVALATYTGLLLGTVPSKALWSSALIPVLFLVSGLVCAIALLTIIGALVPESIKKQTAAASLALKKMKPMLVFGEAMLIGFHLLVIAFASINGSETVKHLLTGDRWFMFMVVQIGIGIVVPTIIMLMGNKNSLSAAAAGLASIIGVFALRMNIVIGGQEMAMVPGSIPVIHSAGWHGMLVAAIFVFLFVASYVAYAKTIQADSAKA